ncbi:MAG TPA: aldehyde dehydrogenase family protein [Streptosporangiaceae bacterium]
MTTAAVLGGLPAGLPVGDGWVATGGTVPVRFPFDGSLVADAPVGTPELARAAVDAAVAARPAMAGMPAHARRAALAAVGDQLRRHRDDLVDLLVLETGKPLGDCRAEADRAILTVQAATEEVGRIHGETVALDMTPAGEGMTGFWVRRPIGVVVGITGFNYPLLLAAHKIAPAIAAGCPVICKPAPQAPLAVLRLAALCRAALRIAGGPAAGVQVVTGDAEVGSALVTDRRVGAVSFTGSAAVGHQIARDAAPAKVLLELGSNSALIVARDASLAAAADAVARGGFYASGQACISVQRVLVDERVAPEFTGLLMHRVAQLRTGDPRLESTSVAALIDAAATRRVRDWVAAAVRAGARVVTGDGAQAGASATDGADSADGAVAAVGPDTPDSASAARGADLGGGADGARGPLGPVVLADVPEDADIWAEEVFGPVVCLRTVRGIDEAIEVANASRYGLHASVFTSSLSTALTALRRLEVGGVVINEVPGFRADNMPYGGVKDSGLGREGPRFAAEEFTVTVMAVLKPLPTLEAP